MKTIRISILLELYLSICKPRQNLNWNEPDVDVSIECMCIIKRTFFLARSCLKLKLQARAREKNCPQCHEGECARFKLWLLRISFPGKVRTVLYIVNVVSLVSEISNCYQERFLKFGVHSLCVTSCKRIWFFACLKDFGCERAKVEANLFYCGGELVKVAGGKLAMGHISAFWLNGLIYSLHWQRILRLNEMSFNEDDCGNFPRVIQFASLFRIIWRATSHWEGRNFAGTISENRLQDPSQGNWEPLLTFQHVTPVTFYCYFLYFMSVSRFLIFSRTPVH